MELGSTEPGDRLVLPSADTEAIWCGEMIDANTNFKHRQPNSSRQSRRSGFRAQLLGSDKV